MANATNLSEQSLFVVFAIIFIGIICQRRKILNQIQIEGFEVFLFKIAMPCYLFNSTLYHDLSTLFHANYIASYLLAFLAIAGLTVLLFRKVSSQSKLCIKILASGYVNTAIYTLPIISLLLKDPTAGILGNLLQIMIVQSTFIVILSFLNHKEKSIAKKLITIFSTPIIIMPLLGLLCNFLQFSPHHIIGQTIQNIGKGATSIALFTFGLTLGSFKFSKSNIDKTLLLIVGLKNILHPTIGFFLGNYIFHLEPYWLYSLIITTSGPTAFVVSFIAKQFNTEQELAKRAIAASSMVSLISLMIITLII